MELLSPEEVDEAALDLRNAAFGIWDSMDGASTKLMRMTAGVWTPVASVPDAIIIQVRYRLQ